MYTPSVATGLIETARKYVVTDPNFTINRMLEFAGVIENLDPNGVRSYQIVVRAEDISGNSVLVPRLGGDNMKAILGVFRGQTPLVAAPAPETSRRRHHRRPPQCRAAASSPPPPSSLPTLAPTVDPAVPVVTRRDERSGHLPAQGRQLLTP